MWRCVTVLFVSVVVESFFLGVADSVKGRVDAAVCSCTFPGFRQQVVRQFIWNVDFFLRGFFVSFRATRVDVLD